MRTIEIAATAPAARTTLAYVPGTYGVPEDFEREGFIAAARAAGFGGKQVLAEIRAAWVADGSILRRLEEQLSRRPGERLWLVGISLGALAILAHAARAPDRVDGLVLIAPYPGTRTILREISEAGGLERWAAGAGEEVDVEREAWRFLAARPSTPFIALLLARQDRFIDGQRRMAASLDHRCVHEVEGAHDWPAWRACWELFLQRHGALLA